LARVSGPRIEALLAALRAAGLGLGVTDSLRVAEVLRAAARESGGAKGRSIDLAELRDLLCCVIASSMEERATFERVFGAWSEGAQGDLKRSGRGLDSEPRAPASGPKPGAPASGGRKGRRTNRWLLRAVAAAALGGVVAVGVLAFPSRPRVEVGGADAGLIEDAGGADAGLIEDAGGADAELIKDAGAAAQDDAGALPEQRPTTYRARQVVFTVELPRAERAIPWQLALTLASVTIAFALGWFVRRSSWLPRVLAPPRVPGPPEVPPLPIGEGPRGAGLFTAGERDDLAFAVDRFIREEPSPEVDTCRSIDATIAAGGRAEIVFRPRIEHRTVWLWTDAAASSPLVPRFAAEVAASLASSGLPSERGRFACVPDRVDSDERGALEPREIEDAAMGSAVLFVTDGEGLARRLCDAASRGWVRPLLRVLSRWPRVAFVGVADEGRRALSAAFVRFDIGVSVLAPDEVQAFLAGQDARRAPRERTRMAGDTLAWAAACCVSGRPVDAPTALALRVALKLDAPVWDLEAVLADVAGASGAGASAARWRADRLRWLAQVSGAGQGGEKVPKGSLLSSALAFFRGRLSDEDDARKHRNAEDPWIDTPAQRQLLRQRALLDLWIAPDEALADLHRLYPTDDPARHTVLAGYAAGASRVESRAPEGVIGLPWAMQDLGDTPRLLAQDLGLRVLGEDRVRRGVPGRAMIALGVALGLCAAAGVGAVARWVKRPTGAPSCVEPEGGWCEVRAGAGGTYTVVAGSGRAWGTSLDVAAGARVTAAWGAETRFLCKEQVSATTQVRRCGKRETPVPRGSAWVMRHSVGVVVGKEGDAKRDAWADGLLDSGSADSVVVTSAPVLENYPVFLATLPGFQVLIVGAEGGQSRVTLPPQVAVAELSAKAGSTEREALTGTEVRSVADTWPRATIRSGHPQLAGVAVAVTEADAGAPAPADPVGLIHNSAECPHREEEDNGLVFVRVCGGTFKMGSKDNDPDAYSDEKPAHDVTVSTFWIGKHEVSNAVYWKFDPGHESGKDADLPATNVSWDEAEKMCASLGHRLPTEAEWEYASGGPEGRRYPWGDAQPTDKLAVFSGMKLTAAKSYLDVASPFGTVHQAGNAWEWVQDCYDDSIYKKLAGSATVDPLIDCPAGGDRVLRGGSFFDDPRLLRSVRRYRNGPGVRVTNFGLRCVRHPRRQP
jgi:formylglycine-generating enzyme required for sulfatase activity